MREPDYLERLAIAGWAATVVMALVSVGLFVP